MIVDPERWVGPEGTLDQFVDLLPFGVFVLDAKGRFLHTNQAYRAYYQGTAPPPTTGPSTTR